MGQTPSPPASLPQAGEGSRETVQRIAVIGGGISGLAAANRLIELSPDRHLTLFERGPRLGGVLWTVHENGYQVEQSADNFITTVPWGVDLCKRLNLGDQLIQTNPAFRRTFVVRKGRLYRLPDGFLMMAPTQMWPLAVTPLLSPLGKMRAALEYLIPPRQDDGDESMADFVRRRLGREVFERLVEPLVSGVYAADMERLSLMATLPRFRRMEQEHGSLIRAMRRQMAARRKAAKSGQAGSAGTEQQSGARYSMFVTLRDGLTSIVDAIAARLPQGSVRLRTPVRAIERQSDNRWTLVLDDGSRETFDAVVLATPSHEAARLLRPVDRSLGEQLAAIEHTGTAIVSVGFDRSQVSHPLDGMGAVVPSIEKSPMLACSFSSQKYAHRAPDGKLLLRIFAGGARAPEMAEMEDGKLRRVLLEELGRILGLRGEPEYVKIAHWPGTMPQYHVGHRERVASVEAGMTGLPNLELAGNAYHGVGLPNCIHSGELAVERILGHVSANSRPATDDCL